MPFNGGKSQVNFNSMVDSGDFAFLNLLKGGAYWTAMDNIAITTPEKLDSNGYPTTIANGGVYILLTVPTQAERPGNYCVTWDGTGTIGFGTGGGAILGTATFTGSISGTVLTIPGSITGTIQFGQMVTGGTTAVQTIIMNQIDATHYTVSKSQTVTSVAMTASGGSLTSSGGAGAGFCASTAIGNSNFTFQITAIGSSSNYISNVQLFHVDDAALLQAGNVFGVKFKQRLVEANYGVLRFVKWQVGNRMNQTTWSTNKAASYAFYGGYEVRANLYAGVTTFSSNAYTTAIFPAIHSSTGAAWTSGGPIDKDTVHVLFNVSATQSGNCSLSIGGSGAINILASNSDTLQAGLNTYPIGGTYRSLATLVYDAKLSAWIKYGGDVAFNSEGIDNGCPPSLMLRLCNEVGAHPWFNVPYLSIDPATDYMPTLMTTCQSYAAANATWMIPRFEGVNECWNTAGEFFGTGYGSNKANAWGWGHDVDNWYGKSMSVLGQMAATVYGIGNKGVTYHVVCGIQTVSGGVDVRLTAAQYVAGTGGGPQSPYTATAATGWVSHVAAANYITPPDYYNSTEATRSTAFAGCRFVASMSGTAMTVTSLVDGTLAIGKTIFGAGIANNALASGITITGGSAPNWVLSSALTLASNTFYAGSDMTQPGLYVGSLTGASTNYNLAKIAALFATIKTWTSGIGVNKLCCYEGGYSPDYTGGIVDVLRYAGKLVPALQTHTTTNYNNVSSVLTGGGFVAEFPSCFEFTGEYPSGHDWPVLESIYQPSPPQHLAIMAFNAVASGSPYTVASTQGALTLTGKVSALQKNAAAIWAVHFRRTKA